MIGLGLGLGLGRPLRNAAVDGLMASALYPIFDASGTPGANTTFTRASTATDPLNLNASVAIDRARVRPFRIGSRTIYAPLIEGARTNAFIGQGGNSASITTDAFGYYVITADGTNSIHRSEITLPALSGGQTYTATIQVPNDGSCRYVYFNHTSNGQANGCFDLLLGTVTNSVGTASIKKAPGGDWLLSVTGVVSNTNHTIFVQINNAYIADDNTFVTTQYLRYKNFQLEQASFPSTYIPTSGSPVTRAADLCTFTVGSQLAAGQGTLFAIGNDSTFKQDSLLLDSSGIAQASIRRLNASTIRTVLNFNSQVDATITPVAGQHTVAVTYDGAIRNTYYNGLLVNSTPNSAVAAGTTEYVGSASSAGYETFDHTTTIFFPRVLTPTEIALIHGAIS